MSAPRTVLIVGGGASGLMAAIAAARRGARVSVLERMQRVGKKILATGNGRCNISNLRPELEHYHGAPRFALEVIGRFGPEETLRLFEELGLALRVEEDGKVFPATDQATAVLDLMRDELERLGVETVCEAAAQRVYREGGRWACATTEGQTFTADRVIVAAGGKSSPNLGSNGAGFKIAEGLGHRIVTPAPALVQLRIDAPYLKQTQGVRVQGAAEAWVDGERQRRTEGEILFTDYGLSGIPIMDLSRIVSEAGERYKAETVRKVSILIDMFPSMSAEELAAALERRIQARPERTAEFMLVGLLHKRVIPVLLRAAGIEDLHIPCGNLKPEQIHALAGRMKAWRMPSPGTQSWMFSQVTAGGVDVKQIDRRTLESKLAPGVFFCGEVLDVDGDCGGYNLQWAWSSGWVAGTHAAQ